MYRFMGCCRHRVSIATAVHECIPKLLINATVQHSLFRVHLKATVTRHLFACRRQRPLAIGIRNGMGDV